MLRFRHVWPVCSWQEGLWQLRVAADCNGKFDRRDHSRRDAVPQHNSPGIFFVHFVYLCDINNKYRFGHCINIKIQLLPCGPIGNSSWNLLNRQQIVYPQQMIYLIFKHLPLVIYIFIIAKKINSLVLASFDHCPGVKACWGADSIMSIIIERACQRKEQPLKYCEAFGQWQEHHLWQVNVICSGLPRQALLLQLRILWVRHLI